MSRTATWLLSLMAALIAFVLLGLRMSFFTVSYVLLLAVSLYHGFYGLHTILTEIWTSRRAGSVIAVLCTALGGGLFTLAVAATAVS